MLLTLKPIPLVNGFLFRETFNLLGVIEPGATTRRNELYHYVMSLTDFALSTHAYRRLQVTLTDPNGYTYTNFANNRFVPDSPGQRVLLEGVPPPGSKGKAVPDDNMQVFSEINTDNSVRTLRIINPIFGDLPWTYTVTCHHTARQTLLVTVAQSDRITINGTQHPIDLTSLDLSNQGLTDSYVITRLRAMAHLTELNLSGNQIGDLSLLNGLLRLRRSDVTKLHTLDLSSNQISDLTALYGVTTLSPVLTLNLCDNPITLAQINALKSTLQQNITVNHNAVCDGCCDECTDCMGICGQPCLHLECDKIYYCGDCVKCVCYGDCKEFPCVCRCDDCYKFLCECARYSGDGWRFLNRTLTITTNAATTAWRRERNGNFRVEDIDRVVIEDGVTNIGNGAFNNCGSLISVTIPDSVVSIGDEAFDFCRSLLYVTIPDGVETIGNGAFWNCESLWIVEIPNSVKTLGGWVFRDCVSLASLKIGSGITSIDVQTFDSCANIESVTIPSGVVSIGRWAFRGATSLHEIRFESAAPPIIENQAFTRLPEGAIAIIPSSWGFEEGSTWNGFIVNNYCTVCGEFEEDCVCYKCTDKCACLDCECDCSCKLCHDSQCVKCNPPPPISIALVDGVIELRNNTENAISTKGLYLSNDDDDLFMWQMPSVIIRPNQTIQINADSKRKRTNFELKVGDTLWLVDAGGEAFGFLLLL
jgi:hypothetical protein